MHAENVIWMDARAKIVATGWLLWRRHLLRPMLSSLLQMWLPIACCWCVTCISAAARYHIFLVVACLRLTAARGVQHMDGGTHSLLLWLLPEMAVSLIFSPSHDREC
jgi:hypothetical protein